MAMTTLQEAFKLGREERSEPRTTTPLLLRAARFLGRRLPTMKRTQRTVTVLSAFACIDYAFFQVHTIAGWFAVGASLLVADALRSE